MRASLAAVPFLPAVAVAQTGEGSARLPYLWVWIAATALLLLVLGWLLFGPSARHRSRAHRAHRARREVHGS